MVWFYERNGSFLRFETRDAANGPPIYELVIVRPDGSESIERFADSESMVQRQLELESALTSVGWQGPYGRFL